jgi:hypothetical protein
MVLKGECSPITSLPFWERHGFERYKYWSDEESITVRRLVQRSFAIPHHLPTANVTISFFPTDALNSDAVLPVAVHNISGVYCDTGTVALERRVVGLKAVRDWDLVVKIEVDGEMRYRGLIENDVRARAVGLQLDASSRAFFIDAITKSDGT